MEYKAYKLRFLTGVHFGKGSLDDTSYAFCADTLFSALCIEALKDSEQRLNNFVNTVKSRKIDFLRCNAIYRRRFVYSKANV